MLWLLESAVARRYPDGSLRSRARPGLPQTPHRHPGLLYHKAEPHERHLRVQALSSLLFLDIICGDAIVDYYSSPFSPGFAFSKDPVKFQDSLIFSDRSVDERTTMAGLFSTAQTIVDGKYSRRERRRTAATMEMPWLKDLDLVFFCFLFLPPNNSEVKISLWPPDGNTERQNAKKHSCDLSMTESVQVPLISSSVRIAGGK